MSGALGGIDPSIPLAAGKGVSVNPFTADPIGTYARLALTRNAIAENQLLQQRIGSTNALGAAYANNIDPTTGQVNAPGVLASVAGSNAPWAAPQAAQDAYAMNSGQLAQAVARRQAAYSGLAPLMTKPNVNIDDVTTGLAQLNASGIPIGNAIMGLSGADMSNPAAIKQVLMQHLVSALPAPLAAQMLTPRPEPQNLGNRIVYPDMNPITSPGIVGAGAVPGMSPGESASQVAGPPTPAGAPTVIPKGSYAAANGLPPPQGGPVPNLGVLNGAFSPRVPVSATPLAPPMPTGLGPGQMTGIQGAAQSAVTSYDNMNKTVAGSAARLFQLQQALQGLQNSPTGPGTDTTNHIKSFALAMAPGVAKSMGIDPNTISSYDEANKYLTQYASTAAGSFGHGTDQQLATALTGNASTHISNLAATGVVKSAVALERMGQAQAQAFAQSGLPPDQFNQWNAGWQKQIDPRVYAFDLMTPQQRTTMIQGMKPAAQTKFFDQVYSATQNGFLTPPQAAGATSPASAEQPTSQAPQQAPNGTT